MSVPPDQPPTTRIPAAGRFDPPPAAPAPTPAPAAPPAVEPPVYATTPAPSPALPTQPTHPPRAGLAAGPYWGGVVATAVVAALIGIAGVVIFQNILDVTLSYQDPFDTGSTMAAYAIGGAVAAIVAGGLLHLLVISTPRPRAFFGWIIGLATLVAALLPLTWTDDTTRAVSSGAINLLVGIAIWSLLAGVLSRTARLVPAH